MDPILLQAHYLIARSQMSERKFEEAEKTVDMIISVCMAQSSTDYKEVFYKAQKLKLDINIENEANRNNISAIMLQIFGEDSEYGAKVLYDLAQFHKVTHDQVRYVEALTQLHEKFPESEYRKDILFELALIQQNQKDMKAAVKSYIGYLNAVGKKHPNVTIAAVNLATCYTALGKTEDAKETLKRYLKISPK